MNPEPLLTVFIDGLKPSSLEHMPFLNSFSEKRRIRTDLGYSITCHATMYSGVYPEKHRIWFMWKYSPDTSPFRILPKTNLSKYLDSLPSRYFFGKMVRLFSNNTSYSGLPVMKRSVLKNWRYFDLSESKFWDEDYYIEKFPTIFEIFRKKGLPFETVGLFDAKANGGALRHIENYDLKSARFKWIYLFIGELDRYSHFYTQESDITAKFLNKIDHEVERIYELLIKQYRQLNFLCFSDHGHMKINDKIDIYELFGRHKMNLNNILHIIDTNFARFWFRNSSEEGSVRKVLEEIPAGFILEDEHYKKYHTRMPDNRYGDLIYYLDYPYMFKKTVWGYGLRTKSIHGYLPDYEDKDGVFISNVPVRNEKYISLTDIAPSILNLLELEENLNFDGTSVWNKNVYM